VMTRNGQFEDALQHVSDGPTGRAP
jgi:hypothetical protein